MHALWLPLALAMVASPAFAGEVTFSNGYPVTRADQLYKLREVKAGDKGVGYTVFSGAQVKPFQVEILGVLQGMLGPHRDVILARLSGPEIEFSGVIAGMSGSPVYVDGRLLGAVSYRFGAFTKEPIAGITPIESMLEIYSDPQIVPPRPPRFAGARAEAPLGTGALRSREPRAPPAFPKLLPPPGPHDPRPIETPIVLSGFAPQDAEWLKQQFAEAGFVAQVGGGGGGLAGSPRATGRAEPNAAAVAGGVDAAPIAPGAPIAGLLMRGDLNVAGTGTVTFLDGKRVLGFGHPFFGFGHVAFPMATASIINTLASLAGSYKQSAPAREVGVIEHDRLTAIAGSLGAVAPMIPVRIDLRGGKAAANIRTQVEIVDHELWFPIMLTAAIASASGGRLAEEAGGTLDARAVIRAGGKAIEIQDTYAALPPQRPGLFLAQDVANAVAMLDRNGLESAAIEGVEVVASAKQEVELAWIEEAVAAKTVVEPGETVEVRARLRPYREEPRWVQLPVPIPADANDEVEIVLGGAVELDRRDSDAIGDRVPDDLEDLMGILAERRPGRGLYGRLYLKRPGLRQSAEVLSSLPPSQRLTLADRAGFRQKAITEALGPELRLPLPPVVVGQTSLKLRVVR
jgi:hypothetical protein